MLEFYPQIRLMHIVCAIASGSLFALRWLLMFAGWRHYDHALLRWLTYAIDTTLLTAALMLATILHHYPLVDGWLTMKVLLLVAYVILGAFALRRACGRRTRVLCFAAALLVFGAIVGVAWTHHPLGLLHTLLS